MQNCLDSDFRRYDDHNLKLMHVMCGILSTSCVYEVKATIQKPDKNSKTIKITTTGCDWRKK